MSCIENDMFPFHFRDNPFSMYVAIQHGMRELVCKIKGI
jgi:hypothetical protein